MAWDHKIWNGFYVHQPSMGLAESPEGIKLIVCK